MTRIFALALFVALVLLRLPAVAMQGRFWAEEGRLYFHAALVMPWWQAALRPANGYLSLYANFAGLLAHHGVPLEQAPRVTEALALLAQSLPALLVLWARDRWLRPWPVRLAAVLLLAMPPGCDEVWLNTANSQFHIVLAAALCLALDTPPAGPGRWRCALLLAAPLCAPTTLALAPLFVWRAWRERARARAWQAACLVAGAVPQLIVMALSPMHERGRFLGPTTMACIFAARHLALPFLGEDAADGLASGWQAAVLSGHLPPEPVLAVAVAACLLVGGVALGRSACAAYLLAGGVALAFLSYNAAVGGGVHLIGVTGSQRYAFAPSLLFALTVACLCMAADRRVAYPARAVLAWLLVVAAWQTVRPQDTVYAEGPAWRLEVTRYRADPAYAPQIWPVGWTIRLQP